VSDTVQLEVELPREHVAPRVARSVVRSVWADRVEHDLLIDAELLVSELTTNALVHGEGDIKLRAGLDAHRVWAEIIDEGGGFERVLREHRRDQVGGWGLGLVADLSTRWGVDDGSRVWFELERGGRRLS
jgi:anti-sigma regulatory factor (Ser/Thr protein kinase)